MQRLTSATLSILLALALLGTPSLYPAAASAASGSDPGTSGTNNMATPVDVGAKLYTQWEFKITRSGEVVDSWSQSNLCTTEGLAAMLGVMFGGWTGVTPWYVGIYDNSLTPVIGDSYASNNMSECTAYLADGAATRAVWHGAVGTGSTIFTNSADPADFTISLLSGSTTIYGAALFSSGVSGDTTSGNTLFSLANFASERTLVNGDTLSVTIQYTLAP